jgi:hypothetical protein
MEHMEMKNYFDSHGFDLKKELRIAVGCHKNFCLSKSREVYFLDGIVRPINSDIDYTIRIKIHESLHPEVFVISPKLHPKTPHRYRGEGNPLCLYKQKDNAWRTEFFITWTVIPLIHMWLFFYEEWKKYRVWLGPEAPHDEENNGDSPRKI